MSTVANVTFCKLLTSNRVLAIDVFAGKESEVYVYHLVNQRADHALFDMTLAFIAMTAGMDADDSSIYIDGDLGQPEQYSSRLLLVFAQPLYLHITQGASKEELVEDAESFF